MKHLILILLFFASLAIPARADLMPDLIHPNGAGAEAWVSAVEPTLKMLMGK